MGKSSFFQTTNICTRESHLLLALPYKCLSLGRVPLETLALCALSVVLLSKRGHRYVGNPWV